jgi:drug/metabolite transporter (DMT)-like permease
MDRPTMTGMGVACGACCGLPMLIAAGALSVGTAAVAGVALGGALAVVATTVLVVRGRAPDVPPAAVAALLAVGVALSAVGLARLAEGSDRTSTAMVVAGVALLACVALLRLPSPTRRPLG